MTGEIFLIGLLAVLLIAVITLVFSTSGVRRHKPHDKSDEKLRKKNDKDKNS